MSQATADPAMFYHLAGGKDAFDKIISPDAVKSADLVEMAGKIKRAFEIRARAVTAEAEREETAASSDRNAGDGLDLQAESDAVNLQRAHTAAVQRHASLQTLWDSYWEAQDAADDARSKLALATGGQAKALAEAEESLRRAEAGRDQAKEAADAARKIVERLEIELKAAKERLTSAEDSWGLAGANVATARQSVAAVKRNQEAYAGWQAAIDRTAGMTEPSSKELNAALANVQRTQAAIEAGALVRQAHERLARAKQHQERAAELRKEVHRLREAAKDTDSVLSAAVASNRFAVQRETLMGTLPDGRQKPYYDLSDGEQTLIAVAEKIDRVRSVDQDFARLAIIDLPQRTFQDIPESVRRDLFRKAASKNCCIVTAQVSDDPELRAEVVTIDSEAVAS
jgi:hypothetical protein